MFHVKFIQIDLYNHIIICTYVRRFEDHVLEAPEYFPLWVHWLKTLEEYKNCAEANSKCRGDMGNRGGPFPGCKKENDLPKVTSHAFSLMLMVLLFPFILMVALFLFFYCVYD